MFICCVIFSYYVFLYISLSPFCLYTSSELCVSSPMLGIIIVFIYNVLCL
jgi:hypothetical protein